MRPTLSAIFIDFDNIYLSLREQDDRAAQAFAATPARWLKPLRSMPDHGPEPARERTFIIRRCYANPSRFSKYRAYFTRSASEVIDCPPLTGGGKNSADIVMVMDILDTLKDYPQVEEF